MRKISAIVVISMILFSGQTSIAGIFQNGNRLYAYMTSSYKVEKAMALGYVEGVYDSWMYISPEMDVLIPDELLAGQLNDIAKLYLEKHPEMRHEGAAKLIQNALLEAFSPKK